MAVLLVPKVLAYVVMLTRPNERLGSGGALRALLSLLLETIISALTAPIMMLFQTRAMAQILAGRDAGWQVQRRDDGSLPWNQLMRQYSLHSAIGLGLGVSAFAVSPSLFLWMTPVIAGLSLAIPIVAITSHRGLGSALRRAGVFLIPEERTPPAILKRVNALAGEKTERDQRPAFARLQSNRALLAAHLTTTKPITLNRGEVNVDLVVARAKLTQATGMQEALSFLSPREVFAVLADGPALNEALHIGPHVETAVIGDTT
jgi:membrane glycosyltransferase